MNIVRDSPFARMLIFNVTLFEIQIIWDYKMMLLLKIIPIFGNFKENRWVMNKNTSISLGNYFDNFIQSRISAGRFKNASEVVRAGLRLLEEEENKIIALRQAIQEGVDSGIAYDFDPKSHLETLKANKNLDGEV